MVLTAGRRVHVQIWWKRAGMPAVRNVRSVRRDECRLYVFQNSHHRLGAGVPGGGSGGGSEGGNASFRKRSKSASSARKRVSMRARSKEDSSATQLAGASARNAVSLLWRESLHNRNSQSLRTSCASACTVRSLSSRVERK